jgi:membrane fusion protein (multidrug efflux system)
MRLTICAAVLICGLALPAPVLAQAQQQAPAATPVGVVKAEKKAIAKLFDFVGRVEAINRVEVRARVTGYLEEVQFKEGDQVKEGAPLYRIEHGLFQAAVEQAQGSLERSNASRALTQIQLSRAQDLLDKAAGTVVARDQAKAADDQAKGAIMQDEAALQTAKINLGYTDITSPIAGLTSKTNVTKGNVVGPDSGVLTMIVSQDPMYVTFPVSQREFLRAQETGRDRGNVDKITAKLRFADGRPYDKTGTINFVDVTVNKATDTVLVRATFPNPTYGLIDGQLVNVTLDLGSPDEKVVVPQAALITDQGGIYVFVVEDGKAVRKNVKTTGAFGTNAVVDTGLNGGEDVIVEGLQTVRPGAPVRATPIQPTLNQG